MVVVRSFNRAAFLAVSLFVLAAFPALASDMFKGKVVRVLDGDTIEVMRSGQAVRIRLHGVDCPEKGQPFGKAARLFTADLVAGKSVVVNVRDKDRYGRLVGEVMLPGERGILNYELIKAGYAWWYKRYAPKERTYKAAEFVAKSKKVGLWADPAPVAPWDWRRGVRTGTKEVKALPALKGEIHGNVKSKVFHRPGCKYYDCKSCTSRFPDAEAAVKAGYRACGLCGG